MRNNPVGFRKPRAVYRGKRARTSPFTVIIIILLVLLTLTLAALLLKDSIAALFRPDVSYPETTDHAETADAAETVTKAPETEYSPDMTKYKPVSTAAYNTARGDLILVNRTNAYVFDGEAALTNLYSSAHENFTLASSSISLSRNAYQALFELTNACKAAQGTCPLMVTSGYRTDAGQEAFYTSMVETEEDKAFYELKGYSDHHTGLAIDVKIFTDEGVSYSYSSASAELLPFFADNYKNYGFIMRYPADKAELTGIERESNHFRYVGIPHAVYMTDNNLCLEEYLLLLKSHTLNDGALSVTVGEDEYSIWYVPGGEDYIYIPIEGQYTVSGDNCGGFIVTAKNAA